MPTAKTYEKYPTVGEPFTENKRIYVIVRTPKGDKKVRWYNDKEYARMYPDAQKVARQCNYRTALGFKDAGYITIYLGENESNEWWFKKQPNCYYHVIWGWYTHSDKEVPTDLPEGVSTRKLYWTNVCTPEGTITEASAQKGYDELILNRTIGNFIGEVGERIEIEVKVEKIVPITTKYGEKFMIVMRDKEENELLWVTTKTLFPKSYKMRMTIVEHKTYRGVNQTFVNRCFIVGE